MGSVQHSYMVLAIGHSRGIIIVWCKDIGHVTFTHIDHQVVFGIVTLPTGPSWILAVVFAGTIGLLRQALWQSVISVSSINLPLPVT